MPQCSLKVPRRGKCELSVCAPKQHSFSADEREVKQTQHFNLWLPSTIPKFFFMCEWKEQGGRCAL